jgi:pilus assembly protein Flp/PilA
VNGVGRLGRIAGVQHQEMVMKSSVSKFLDNESGATAIEYGLIGALISVIIITAVKLVGSNLSETFNKIAQNLS